MSWMKKVTEVQPGDIVRFPGSFVHEDMSGLIVVEKVIAVTLDSDRTYLHWSNESKTWWTNDEMVEVIKWEGLEGLNIQGAYCPVGNNK